MNNPIRFITLSIPILISLIFAITPALADTESESILAKMEKALHPDGLESFTCTADVKTEFLNLDPERLPHLASLNLPDIKYRITYIAPYDFRVEITGDAVPGTIDLSPLRLRGDDPMLLSNPAMKQALLAVYDASYEGEVFIRYESFDEIVLTPLDGNDTRPFFKLYIRTVDHIPGFTVMEIPFENESLAFASEIEFVLLNGYRLPSKIITEAEFTDGGKLSVVSTFSDYKINMLPAEIEDELSVDEEPDDEEFAFADIYHGFEKPLITIELSEKSDPYKQVMIGFALEVESKSVAFELDKNKELIIGKVKEALDGRDLLELQNEGYEVGRELRAIINGILREGKVDDFYFTTLEPLR